MKSNLTAIEWLQEIEIERDLNLGDWSKAKAMEKQQIMDAINEVSENNVKYANMTISLWSQIEGELFTHNTKLAEQYYKETYE